VHDRHNILNFCDKLLAESSRSYDMQRQSNDSLARNALITRTNVARHSGSRYRFESSRAVWGIELFSLAQWNMSARGHILCKSATEIMRRVQR